MSCEKNYFTAFFNLSRAFGTAATKSELLALIVQNAIDNMNGKAACLFLADENKDVFVPVAQKGLSDAYLHASPMKSRRIVASLVKLGHLSFPDAVSDPRLENHEAKKSEGIASILTVPVMVKGRVIGVLSLYTAEKREFNEPEIRFLQALAEQGGMAIENSRLVERMEKNAALFLELASKINSSLDIKEVMKHLTIEVTRLLGLKGAAIRLLDPDTDGLKLVADYGVSEKLLQNGHFISTQATETTLDETLVIKNISTDQRIRHAEELEEEGIGAAIVTPIKAKDQTIGTLSLFSKIPRDFPKDVIVMVQALAHQGALAIQNASMYLKLQEDKRDLEAEIWSHRSWF